MKNKSTLKVGDKIVEFGRIYRIFKIEKQKNDKGKDQKVIFFRPYFKSRENATLVYSIPVDSLNKASIREPFGKKELKELLKKLSQKINTKAPVNPGEMKETLSLNDPYETGRILKNLWAEKNDESINFTKSRKDAFEMTMSCLLEEAAFISGASFAEARKKIEVALKKGLKNSGQQT